MAVGNATPNQIEQELFNQAEIHNIIPDDAKEVISEIMTESGGNIESIRDSAKNADVSDISLEDLVSTKMSLINLGYVSRINELDAVGESTMNMFNRRGVDPNVVALAFNQIKKDSEHFNEIDNQSGSDGLEDALRGKYSQQLLSSYLEQDIEKMQRAFAPENLGSILNVNDPKQWIEDRIRTTVDDKDPYRINMAPVNQAEGRHNITGAGYRVEPEGAGQITFGSLQSARNQWMRIHELIHKVTDFPIEGGRRIGLTSFVFSENGTAEIRGTGFNEGATELLTERVMGQRHNLRGATYVPEVFLARQIKEMVGEDVFFGAMFDGPEKIMEKYDSKTSEGSFIQLIDKMDETGRLQRIAGRRDLLEQKGVSRDEINLKIESIEKQTQQSILDANINQIRQLDGEEKQTAKTDFLGRLEDKKNESADIPQLNTFNNVITDKLNTLTQTQQTGISQQPTQQATDQEVSR